MKKTIINLGLLWLLCTLESVTFAMEVEGVHVPDTVKVNGETLFLNGAGIRSKFFFDIYIGALYLPQKTDDAEQAMASVGSKRSWMHFLYDEVSRDKLVSGWNEGFQNNQTKDEMLKLQERLNQFNGMFGDMKKGDEITFDFVVDEVHVSVNQQAKGSIQGKDFQQALMKVWLGKKPADGDLKEGLLGED